MTNELKAILYLHILLAMLLIGGSVAVAVLVLRARSATSLADLRTSVRDARAVQSRIVMPAAGLVGIFGAILAIRYDNKGIFDFAEQTWIHISIVLWIVINVLWAFAGRGMDGAIADETRTGAGDLAAVKARVTAPRISGLIWLNVLVGLVVLYLMVFQP